jgi:hypothetical protein
MDELQGKFPCARRWSGISAVKARGRLRRSSKVRCKGAMRALADIPSMETDHTVTIYIEHASFPNWEGTERKSPFTLTGDEFKHTVANPTTGGANVTGEIAWKRVH